jgi:hypothetical protein
MCKVSSSTLPHPACHSYPILIQLIHSIKVSPMVNPKMSFHISPLWWHQCSLLSHLQIQFQYGHHYYQGSQLIIMPPHTLSFLSESLSFDIFSQSTHLPHHALHLPAAPNLLLKPAREHSRMSHGPLTSTHSFC